MWFLKWLVLGLSAIGATLFAAILTDNFPPKPPMPVVEQKWFGPGQSRAEDKSIKTFSINVPDKILTDLKTRIKLDTARLKTSHPSPLEDTAFTYGFNSNYLTSTVADYWLNKYDWRAQEKMLNKFPQFVTNVDGINVHFLHVKPDSKLAKGKTVLPLLVSHGWPGSVIEFVKIIPMLTTPAKDSDFVFEVVAPSIPGYGYSSAPAKSGFHAGHCARIFVEVMNRLGHDKFYAQGGDWGSLISAAMATLYPEKLHGLHLNMAVSNVPSANLKLFLSSLRPSLFLDAKDYAKVLPLGEKFKFLLLESGYLHIQATKPDTVGIGLNTSPLGLASYILEKFSTWTNKNNRHAVDGNLTGKFSLDDLLNNVMLYWVTGSITSSQRFYAENFGNEVILALDRQPVHVPTGVAAFPEELFVQPKSFLSGKFHNILTYNDMERGGHFAAFEEPQLLANDIIAFVKAVRSNTNKKSEL